MRRTLSG